MTIFLLGIFLYTIFQRKLNPNDFHRIATECNAITLFFLQYHLHSKKVFISKNKTIK